jgi:four helix bundle protein
MSSGEKTFYYRQLPLVWADARIYFYTEPKQLMMAFKFEKLVVWQRAVDLSETVSQLSKNFPKDEAYVLTSQIRRAADAVSLHIAEGSGQPNAEFRKMLGTALKSNLEVVACLYLARRRKILKEEDFEKLYKVCDELAAMINGLRKKLTLKPETENKS